LAEKQLRAELLANIRACIWLADNVPAVFARPI
jgi:hypothetical protein